MNKELEKYLKGLVVVMMNAAEVEDYDEVKHYGQIYLDIVEGRRDFIINDGEI